ncbi:MAG TPA: SIS domain-containing protein [Candidatus Babeliales bacterium]|nr:SIS domain-containing protein [Candidatus Babeliales bacterium]
MQKLSESLANDRVLISEIFKQRIAISDTITFCRSVSNSLYKLLSVTQDEIRELSSIVLIASGTSWHAARVAQFFFETVCRLPVRVFLASEFKYMPFFPEKGSLCVVISHSGETTDSIEALRIINKFELPTIALSSVISSSLVREANGFLLTSSSGLHSSVSIQGFTTQIAALYWLAHHLAFERGTISKIKYEQSDTHVLQAAQILHMALELHRNKIENIVAPAYAQAQQFVFLGRHITYPLALEAALKTKELSRVFAQSFPSGELKHGPFAIFGSSVPIIIFSHPDPLMYQKILHNALQIKHRSSPIIAFLFEGQHELEALADSSFVFPYVDTLLVPLAMAGLMQFFSYQIGVEKGYYSPIDFNRISQSEHNLS